MKGRIGLMVLGAFVLIALAGAAGAWVLARQGDMQLRQPTREEDPVAFCNMAAQTGPSEALAMAASPSPTEGQVAMAALFWKGVAASAPADQLADAEAVLVGVKAAADGRPAGARAERAAERLDTWIERECPSLVTDPGVDPPPGHPDAE